jgi:integrase
MVAAVIVKRGKVYYSRIWHNGKLHQRSLRVRDKNTALQQDAALKTALVTGEHAVGKNSPTLRDFEQKFFAHLKLTVKPRTLAFYQEQYDVLLKSVLADMRLSLIDTAAVDAFKAWRSAQKFDGHSLAIATINHAVRTLRRILHQAEEWHVITRAPKLRLLPGENQRNYVLTNEEVTRLIDFAREGYPVSKFQYLVPVLVDTGLRVSEACQLKRDDVWLGAGPHLTVTEGKSRFAKREVPLTARAVTAIEAAWKLSRCSYVFTAHGGRRPLTRHYATQQFRLLADSIGSHEAVLHSCRHTFCTNLGESGCDAFTIQKLAGHSTITISQRYVHPNKGMAQSAIQRLEDLSKTKTQSEHQSRRGGPKDVSVEEV